MRYRPSDCLTIGNRKSDKDNFMNIVAIDSKLIGGDNPCYVIAEAGVNHNGDMEIAHKLIDEAVACKADAVKFQTFVAEDLVTKMAAKANYQIETTGSGGGQLEMLKALELSPEQCAILKTHCDETGITFLCTPYEIRSASALVEIDIAAIKIASTDTTNIPFLRSVADFGRPVILSTGMCTMSEVEDAVEALQKIRDRLIILHCTSEYPAPIEDINLSVIASLSDVFQCPAGYSDHTEGIEAGPWSLIAGAKVIEKHFTLDTGMAGPDHRASLNPGEMAQMIGSIRRAEMAFGDGVKNVSASERDNRDRMRKSLVAVRYISKGQTISADDLACKRPGSGLPPKLFDVVIGQKAAVDIQADSILMNEQIIWDDRARTNR